MDILLGKITSQAVNYAIRSGVAITSTYAIKQCSRLVKEAPRGSDRQELAKLQIRLQSKIQIISPAIDMIELIAARGNTSLESAVSLTKDIRWEIQALGVRLANAANEEELLSRRSKRAKSREQNELEMKLIISDVRKLLDRIEDAVPLINLAITTSGVNLSTNLPATVSPSRLLQASTFLTAADSQYSVSPGSFVQVGPVYTLSMYMLFAGHANRPHDEDSIRETTWKEVIHKARVKLVRVPLDSLYYLPGEASNANDSSHYLEAFPADGKSVEFAYQLMLVEDLDDGRVHTFEEDEPQPGPFEDIPLAGIRDVVPIHQVSKIFYADTGKILNIGTEGETNNPVLLIKRDIHAEPPRRKMERQEGSTNSDEDYETERSLIEIQNRERDDGSSYSDDDYDEDAEISAQFERESTPVTPAAEEDEPPKQLEAPPHDTSQAHWRLPVDLDPEWIALEVYTEDPDSDDEEDSEPPSSRPSASRATSLDPGISNAFANLNLHTPSPAPSSPGSSNQQTPTPTQHQQQHIFRAPTGPIKTSLSLLEMLIRLTALQQFRQASHLTIEDELLNFFLEDSATTGAGANAEFRQRIRRDARRRVGFDPYDESPIKRRGEEYLAHPRSVAEEWEEGSGVGRAGERGWGREGPVREGSYFDESGRYSSPAGRSERGGSSVRESVEYGYGGNNNNHGGYPYSRFSASSRRESAGSMSSSSALLSSPSPAFRPPLQQHSARSPPAVVAGRRASPGLRSTPPPPPNSIGKGRKAVLRRGSELMQRERVGSPLARHSAAGRDVEREREGVDSGVGTSPGSDEDGDEGEGNADPAEKE